MYPPTAADFIGRFPSDTLPQDGAGKPDRKKIDAALTGARETVIGYLPFLVDEAGKDVAPPQRIRRTVIGIIMDVAYWRLTDRVSSDEDARERCKAAVRLLERLSATEQDGREGPGSQKASIVKADAKGKDPRVFKKGFMV